jgi:hypothetical protein
MRRRITWRSAAAISMLGLAPAIGAAFAVPAGASTYSCAAALGTQCGTFTENAYSSDLVGIALTPRNIKTTQPSGGGASGGLGWAVKDASSASGTPLIAGPNYSPGIDQSTDLTKVEHYGTIPGSPGGATGIGYWYSFVYTPSGEWTSMCVANPNNSGRDGSNLVLRTCNQQKWQAFLALPISGGRESTPRRGNPVLPSGHKPVLPPAPNWRAPTSSLPIPNISSTSAYALYSMANGRFVEVTGPGGSGPGGSGPGGSGPGGSGPGGSGPGYKGRALSATAYSGEPATNTNTWFWTNANGPVNPK